MNTNSGLPVSAPPPGQPLWQRFFGWPSTRLGLWIHRTPSLAKYLARSAGWLALAQLEAEKIQASQQKASL